MNGIASVDHLWRTIRSEAESAVTRDPVFGAALSESILAHPDFTHALAHRIGARLGRTHADRAPKIGKGVLLSAGSTIIGNVRIGDFAKIGAGALVEHDVPASCTAVGVPARLTNCPELVMSS